MKRLIMIAAAAALVFTTGSSLVLGQSQMESAPEIQWNQSTPDPVENIDGPISGHKDIWTWMLVGVLVLALVLIFLGIMLFIAMREDHQQREMSEQIQRIHDLEQKLADTPQFTMPTAADQAMPAPPGADAAPAPARTVVYAESALAVILTNRKTGADETLAVHKINGRSIDAPKYTLGRDRDCDVCLVGNGISGHHCDIYADFQGNTFIFDLHSSNGTFIHRGEEHIRIKGEHELKDGDVLILGNERMGGVVFDVAIKDLRDEMPPEDQPEMVAEDALPNVGDVADDATRATVVASADMTSGMSDETMQVEGDAPTEATRIDLSKSS